MSRTSVVLLLCALLQLATATDTPEQEPGLLLQTRLDALVTRLWQQVRNPQWVVIMNAQNGADRRLLKEFDTLRDDFTRVESSLAFRNSVELLKRLQESEEVKAESNGRKGIEKSQRSTTSWRRAWQPFYNTQKMGMRLYSYMRSYMDKPEAYGQTTLEDYANKVLRTDEFGTASMLEQIHQSVADFHLRSNVLLSLKQRINTNSADLCSVKVSPQQLLYDLYSLVALTEAKGYAMLQFSWMLLKVYGKGNFTHESKEAEKNYKRRIKTKAYAVQNVLREVSNSYWRCDPEEHSYMADNTYTQLTELLQGYIENEVDMNNDNTCKENCAYYSYAQSHSCYHNLFCAKQRRCKGRLFDCRFVDEDSTICMSDRDHRRYESIEYEDGQVYGRKHRCRKSYKVDSWWRWLFWHCSYCMCLCDEPGPHSDRYFSLRSSVSNVSDNEIVTGVRFRKEKRMIHIQLQTGKAKEQGEVEVDTVEWKPVPDFTIEDSDALNGVDYMQLSWEQRSLDLDDLHAPDGNVVTGARFRNLGGHINLEIQVTPINFTTGVLNRFASKWISNDNTPAQHTEPRTELKLRDPDDPVETYAPSQIDSETDQFVKFRSSSRKKDVAQLTVPFIDIQPVAPNPTVWLQGVGIYHKGTSGFGGFVGLRVYTLDYSHYLNLPSEIANADIIDNK